MIKHYRCWDFILNKYVPVVSKLDSAGILKILTEDWQCLEESLFYCPSTDTYFFENDVFTHKLTHQRFGIVFKQKDGAPAISGGVWINGSVLNYGSIRSLKEQLPSVYKRAEEDLPTARLNALKRQEKEHVKRLIND